MEDVEFGRPRKPYQPNVPGVVWDEICGQTQVIENWTPEDGWQVDHGFFCHEFNITVIVETDNRGHQAIWLLRGDHTDRIKEAL